MSETPWRPLGDLKDNYRAWIALKNPEGHVIYAEGKRVSGMWSWASWTPPEGFWPYCWTDLPKAPDVGPTTVATVEVRAAHWEAIARTTMSNLDVIAQAIEKARGIAQKMALGIPGLGQAQPAHPQQVTLDYQTGQDVLGVRRE